MKPLVYIETTIPSFYYEIREEPAMVARRQWTRAWWDDHRRDYEVVTSAPVIEELQRGRHPNKKRCLELIESIPIIPIDDEVFDIIESYISHQVMPKDPKGDAMHLAMASIYNCQFLLTWNCVHLANANKREHIRHVNTLLGLYVPIITTPLEMMNDKEE